jgi:hypothetical protein
MAIDSTHSEYDKAEAKWKRCRHAIAGQDAVHAAGTDYLPKLSEQSAPEYEAYKMRASYFNASGRTLEGLVGMVFRKNPVMEAPAGLDDIVEDADLKGNHINQLAQAVLDSVLGVGRIGILVEYPIVTDKPNNAAEASQRNLRPYASVYATESIFYWRCARINNVYQTVEVRLWETYEKPDGEIAKQIRVLMLNDAGIYIQQIWRQSEFGKNEWEQVGGDITPLIRSVAIRFIPFFPFGPKENSLDVQDSPLLDLVDLNLSHYRVTADYEHGCHFTGLPTPFISGITLDDGAVIRIGSATAITSSDPGARASFLEFTGQGLTALENNLDRKEKQMAAIGARMLEQQKNGVESEGAMQMRSNGESSALASIANLVAKGMLKMLDFMREWEGVPGAVKYELNTDYMPLGMTGDKLRELVKTWQSGGISFETLFENLKRGEIIAESRTFEEERELIADGSTPPESGNGNAE